MLLNQVRKLEQAVGARGRGQVGPGGLSGFGAGDGAVNVGLRGDLEVRNLLLRRGVEQGEGLALGRVGESAVDEEACTCGELAWFLRGVVGGVELERGPLAGSGYGGAPAFPSRTTTGAPPPSATPHNERPAAESAKARSAHGFRWRKTC